MKHDDVGSLACLRGRTEPLSEETEHFKIECDHLIVRYCLLDLLADCPDAS